MLLQTTNPGITNTAKNASPEQITTNTCARHTSASATRYAVDAAEDTTSSLIAEPANNLETTLQPGRRQEAR